MIKPRRQYDANTLAHAIEAAKILFGHAGMDTMDVYLLEKVKEAMKAPKKLADQHDQRTEESAEQS
jgi:hypothetical protein